MSISVVLVDSIVWSIFCMLAYRYSLVFAGQLMKCSKLVQAHPDHVSWLNFIMVCLRWGLCSVITWKLLNLVELIERS